MSFLPSELLTALLGFVDRGTLVHAKRVCRRWSACAASREAKLGALVVSSGGFLGDMLAYLRERHAVARARRSVFGPEDAHSRQLRKRLDFLSGRGAYCELLAQGILDQYLDASGPEPVIRWTPTC